MPDTRGERVQSQKLRMRPMRRADALTERPLPARVADQIPTASCISSPIEREEPLATNPV
ncbi:MAG: hypothetical protein N3F11_09285 [Casimicrobiaceae bacterium]|nr:hypothetical protein [Casimicrobiaceae bacterium]